MFLSDRRAMEPPSVPTTLIPVFQHVAGTSMPPGGPVTSKRPSPKLFVKKTCWGTPLVPPPYV